MADHLATIIAPFRRDKKRDWASGTGSQLLRSKLSQVLLTEGSTPLSSGELPWRTSFGSALHLLRHQRNDELVQALASVYIREALGRWLPEAELTEVNVQREGPTLQLRVRFTEAAASPATSDRAKRELAAIVLDIPLEEMSP